MNHISQIRKLVEKGLGHLFITSSSSNFFHKNRFRAVPLEAANRRPRIKPRDLMTRYVPSVYSTRICRIVSTSVRTVTVKMWSGSWLSRSRNNPKKQSPFHMRRPKILNQECKICFEKVRIFNTEQQNPKPFNT